MSGLIIISRNAVRRVDYDFSGSSLCLLVNYFKSYMSSSEVLMSDEHFKRIIGAAPFVDWLPLDQCTDETVAEVARLMSEALDPKHPFWTKEYYEGWYTLDEFLEECAKTGKDADAEILKIQETKRKSYREIIALIHERLGTSPSVGEQAHAT
jgi:hypothetical protein